MFIFTFAVLVLGTAEVTRFAVLAVWSCCVVKTVQTFARHAVTGIVVLWVGVVVAGTLLAVGTRNHRVTIETREAPVAVWT